MNPQVDIIAGSGADRWLIYLSLLGFIVTISVLISLLTERERMLMPSIVGGVVIVAIIALFSEASYGAGGLVRSATGYGSLIIDRATLFVKGSPEVKAPEPEVIIVEKEVRVEVPVEVPVKVRDRSTRRERPVTTPQPKLSVSMDYVPTTKTTRTTKPEPAPTPVPVPTPKPTPVPEPVKPEPKKAPTRTEDPEPEVTKVAKRTEDPKPMPAPTKGGRTDEGLVLPTANLSISLKTTIMKTLKQKASKARLNIYFDGKYVGGRSSKPKIQNDADGNPINYTYIWKNPRFKLSNMPTGNHKVSIKLSIKGEGGTSKTVWSGSVYLRAGQTTAVSLVGNWMSGALTRVQ